MKKFYKFLFAVFVIVAVGFPLYERLKVLIWGNGASIIGNVFPLLGLAAFTLLWIHSICGVFESAFRKIFDFDKFINLTSRLILALIILHPLLLIIYSKFNLSFLGTLYLPMYLWLGLVGLGLLLVFDFGKIAKIDNKFFAQNWNWVLFISTLGFLVIFFHSLFIGTDIQVQPLRTVWYFYGITGILATIYTYLIKGLAFKKTAHLAR